MDRREEVHPIKTTTTAWHHSNTRRGPHLLVDVGEKIERGNAYRSGRSQTSHL